MSRTAMEHLVMGESGEGRWGRVEEVEAKGRREQGEVYITCTLSYMYSTYNVYCLECNTSYKHWCGLVKVSPGPHRELDRREPPLRCWSLSCCSSPSQESLIETWLYLVLDLKEEKYTRKFDTSQVDLLRKSAHSRIPHSSVELWQSFTNIFYPHHSLTSTVEGNLVSCPTVDNKIGLALAANSNWCTLLLNKR